MLPICGNTLRPTANLAELTEMSVPDREAEDLVRTRGYDFLKDRFRSFILYEVTPGSVERSRSRFVLS